MESFASGVKRNYYGKGDTIVYRLYRDGNVPEGQGAVFGANVLLLIYGDAFWPTYTTGDNTGLIATDSMKNFIQRETLNFAGSDLEAYCLFLAEKFLTKYPQTEGAQVTATEIPYEGIGGGSVAFAPAGPERARARVEMQRGGDGLRVVEARSGIGVFQLLRLRGSAFSGFLRDEYTTLPDIRNRPLHMWLDLDWTYTDAGAALTKGAVTEGVRRLVHEFYSSFESGSIQEIIYQVGMKILEAYPAIAELRLEGNNRTWDTVAEVGDTRGTYTDARPPYGCLGLTLRR
ncbi:MAG: urate oxidase [Acidobacteria bacterium]|nr:urate oxidase [Acidobacteriota bacterium]